MFQNNLKALFICFFSLFICSCSKKQETQIKIENGILDLSKQSDFSKLKIEIDSKLFYKKDALLSPSDFITKNIPKPDGLVTFNKPWASQDLTEKGFKSKQVISYWAKIKVEREMSLAFLLKYISSASDVYIISPQKALIQGVVSIGRIGLEREHIGEFTRSKAGNFSLSAGEHYLLIRISNFSHYKWGGVWQSPILGNPQEIYKESLKIHLTSILVVGIMAIMAVYHLALFMLRRKIKSYIYFTILSTAFGLRTWLKGGYLSIFDLGESDIFVIATQSEYALNYIMLVAALWFYYEIFPTRLIKKLSLVMSAVYLPALLMTIFSSFENASRLLLAFQLFTVLVFVLLLFEVTKLFLKGNDSAKKLFIFSLIFFFTAVNDILYARGIIDTGNFMQLGFVIFILGQSYILASQSAKAFETSEHLSKNLKEEVEIQTRELKKTRDEAIVLKTEAENSKETALIAKEFAVKARHRAEAAKSQIEEQKKQIEKQADELKETLAELNELQDQLLQSEKMSAMGKLIAGVMHEINNPLNFVKNTFEGIEKNKENIKSNLGELLPEDDEEWAETREMFDEDFKKIDDLSEHLKNGLSRIRELINQLTSYSRKEDSQKKVISLLDCINGMKTMLASELKKVNYEESLAEDLKVICNANKIEQVLMNITNNAIYAGETKNGLKARLKISAKKEGKMALIEIEDNGAGIPKDHQQKIFDLFFTTKPVGKGTGMGLSICFKIIDDHGGTIQFDTSEKGTCFKIALPLSE